MPAWCIRIELNAHPSGLCAYPRIARLRASSLMHVEKTWCRARTGTGTSHRHLKPARLPTSPRARKLVRLNGIEPPTTRLSGERSTAELQAHVGGQGSLADLQSAPFATQEIGRAHV